MNYGASLTASSRTCILKLTEEHLLTASSRTCILKLTEKSTSPVIAYLHSQAYGEKHFTVHRMLAFLTQTLISSLSRIRIMVYGTNTHAFLRFSIGYGNLYEGQTNRLLCSIQVSSCLKCLVIYFDRV